MKNIVLIGLPGCGKTTLGRLTALALGCEFFDMDEYIEIQAGMTVAEIFARRGESGFRDLETRAAAYAAGLAAVVAAGGGVVLREINMRALSGGLVIFIDRPPEKIMNDINISPRPLLSGGAQRLYDLDRERRPLYERYAHAVLRNDNGPDGALDQLLVIVRKNL